jgi:hypothetical protein
MDIDRRQLLIGAALYGALGPVHAGLDPLLPGIRGAEDWHPLTRSLLESARRVGRSRIGPNRAMVERAIQQLANASSYAGRPVIKWMDTPSDAFDHLSRYGLDALLDMGTAGFWRGFQPRVSADARTLDRAFEVRLLAGELLCVDEHDRSLMTPKLRAKSEAMSAGRSDGEVFRVRAVSSQIGWLETSMADAAAEAVSNVELLLSAGAPVSSLAIDNQLTIFELCERGLLATWETPAELICVPGTFELLASVDLDHCASRCPLWMAPALQEIN